MGLRFVFDPRSQCETDVLLAHTIVHSLSIGFVDDPDHRLVVVHDPHRGLEVVTVSPRIEPSAASSPLASSKS